MGGMTKGKTLEEPQKARRPPVTDLQPPGQDKVTGPARATQSPPKINGMPPPVQMASMLASPDVAAGSSHRAKVMTSMQRAVGNARIARLATGQIDPTPGTGVGTAGAIPGPTGIAIQRSCGSAAGCAPCRAAAALGSIQRAPAGRALDPASQSSMQSKFGQDFSGVRVHTDQQAASMAENMNARAFTTGRDVFFARGQYEPGSTEGKGLLAHELTHVVQQRSGRAPPARIDTPGDPFEQEAAHVARTVMAGQQPPTPTQRVSQPLVQRATGTSCPVFEVPQEKGGHAQVGNQYQAHAASTGLKVRLGDRPTGQTETLRRRWLEKKGHAGELSKLKEDDAFPRDNEGKNCTVDHIVEWVLHGPEDPANMMLMAGRRNSGAGSKVKNQVAALPGNCKSFSTFTLPARPTEPDECMTIEVNFEKWLAAKTGGASDPTLFIIRFHEAEIPVDLAKAKREPGAAGSTIYTSAAKIMMRAAEKDEETKGILLDEIRLPIKSGALVEDGTIQARISETVAFPVKGNVTKVILRIQKKDNKVVLDSTKYPVEFPGLSETTFDFKTNEAGEVEGHAQLVPSKPILDKTVIHLIVKNGELSAKVQVPVKDLNLPVPGLTLSGDGLIVGFENRAFFASGQVILQYSKIARGELTAMADKGGFSAKGVIDLMIPGLDKARGEVWLDTKGKVGGRITVSADKLKVPGVKSANLVVSIEDGALAGKGEVELSIPGVKKGTLDFGVDKEGNYAITGTALLAIPGLDEATLALTYRNGDIEGAAHVGLKIPGLEGATFDVLYAKGALTGSGRLTYKKGKLSGVITVALSERHRLSGGGELAYEIAPGLVAFAGMQIDEEGHTKISGGLRVPETIDLFGRKQVEKELFKLPTIEIPIFAIPLGTRSAGLVATIDARMVARAGIGPGQLRKVKLLAELDPSKDESAFSFHAAAELYVPASAELALAVAGGLGLSLAIIRAVGGIEAEGAAGLTAEFIAATELSYVNGQFAVEGKAELSAQPRLVFRLKAFVKAEMDLWFTTVELYRKDWTLASFEAGSSLKVGVRVPFRYVFGQPFDLSLDQIEFIVPAIDAKSLMKDLLPA